MVEGKITLIKCPLCHSNRRILSKIYDVEMIIRAYGTDFDVAHLFGNSEDVRLYICVDCSLMYFEPCVEGDDSFYRQLSKIPWYYSDDKNEYDFAIRKLIKLNPVNVLEIGAGIGHFATKIENAFVTRVTEQSSEALSILRSRNIELDDGVSSYDFIVAFQVLEHIREVSDFISKFMWQRLNPGGYLLITVPNPESDYNREIFQILDFPPHHVTRWTKDALLSLGRIFEIDPVEYYEEEYTEKHYLQLLDERIEKINKGLSKNNASIVVSVDPNQKNHKGHTHGMLYRKRS